MAAPWITPEAAAALVGSTVRIALMVTLEFRSTTVRVWSGAHRISIDGTLWEPVGAFGSVSGLDVGRSPVSEPVTFEMSGVDDGILALAVGETNEVAGRPVSVVARLFDDAWQPVASPLPVWNGVMSRIRIRRTDGDEPQRIIGVECEGIWESRSRQAAGRFNDGDQNSRYPGDKFFRFTSNQSTRPAVWPDF